VNEVLTFNALPLNMQKTWIGMLITKLKSERRKLTDVEEVLTTRKKYGQKSAKRSLQTMGQDVSALKRVDRCLVSIVYITFFPER